MASLNIDFDNLKEPSKAAAWGKIDLTDAVEVPEDVLKNYKNARGLGRALASRQPNSGGAVRTVDGVCYIVRKDLNGIK